MNSCNVLWCLVLIRSIDFSLSQSKSSSGNSQLFLGKYKIPSKTPSPLNIDTSKVKDEKLPPILFTAVAGTNAKIINTGHAVEAIAFDQDAPQSTVTGGPLGDKIYQFYSVRYFWSSNLSEPAGTLVNDEDGVPIEAVSFWYNKKKYGSLENSINYRDGVATITYPVKVGPLPSLTFIPFAKILKKIQKPGSFVITNLAVASIWVDGYILPKVPYFSYPGSLTNQETSKEYYCTTVITFQPHTISISEDQFEDLLTLENSKGGQLINVAQSHQQGDIPVIQAEGQIQVFLPVGALPPV